MAKRCFCVENHRYLASDSDSDDRSDDGPRGPPKSAKDKSQADLFACCEDIRVRNCADVQTVAEAVQACMQGGRDIHMQDADS